MVKSKTCLRCDWEGDVEGPTCPTCGEQPLYVAADLATARPSPTSEHGTSSIVDDEGRSRGSALTTTLPSPDIPSPPTGALLSQMEELGPASRSSPATVAFVMGGLLLIVIGGWFAAHRQEPAGLVSPQPALEEPTTDAVSHPLPLTVAGIHFSFDVPAPGWERFGDISINKSIVGPQGAEAIVFWTRVPRGDLTYPCADVLGYPTAGPSIEDLATAVSKARGTELISGPSDTRVDQLPAKHVVVKIRKRVGCDPGFFFTWTDRRTGAFWTRTHRGDTVRAWIVDVRGAKLFIEAVTTVEADAELEREIRQIVRSIRIG